MKKLCILTVFLLCGSLGLSQIAHAFTAEFTNCDVVKAEQHLGSSKVKAASDDTSSKKSDMGESCCESCHTQLVSMPHIPVDKTAPGGELFAAVPASPSATFTDTLSEPPQA